MNDPTQLTNDVVEPSSVPPITQPPDPPTTALFGPDGLRPGWRFLSYLALAVVVGIAFNFIAHRLIHKKPPEIVGGAIGEFAGLLVAYIPAFIMARFEKRSLGTYGLPAQSAFGRNFWIGAVWGFVAVSLLLLGIGGVGDFSIHGLFLHGFRILKFAAFWGVFFLCVGFFEEFLTRGYTQFTLAQGIGFWPAAALLSVAFGALHLGNAGENKVGIVAVVMVALFFCLTLHRTGTLWFAIGFHASFDWGESYFYSVPDSGSLSPGHLLNSTFTGSRWITGGTAGPEGSVFVLVLIVLLCVVFDRVYPEVKYRV